LAPLGVERFAAAVLLLALMLDAIGVQSTFSKTFFPEACAALTNRCHGDTQRVPVANARLRNVPVNVELLFGDATAAIG
jgi:hypothetical protein